MDAYCYGSGDPMSSPNEMDLTWETKVVTGGSSNLPDITKADEGKFLKVVDQKPQWMPSESPISTTISHIEAIDRADYDALEVKDPYTLYLIKG